MMQPVVSQGMIQPSVVKISLKIEINYLSKIYFIFPMGQQVNSLICWVTDNQITYRQGI